MYVFIINDKAGKVFNFFGKVYKTPCRIIIDNHKEIDQLNHILKQHNIKNVKIENKIKTIHSRQITKPTTTQGTPISSTLHGGLVSTKLSIQRSTSITSAATVIKF